MFSMIAGIGVDMATTSRIAKAYDRFGHRFARRVLNEAEWSDYENHPYPTRFLTKRFAVKEAAVKALGTGERTGVLLKDFFLQHDTLGKPILCVSGEAQKHCITRNIEHFWVSLTDEGDSVVAFVVMEYRTGS